MSHFIDLVLFVIIYKGITASITINTREADIQHLDIRTTDDRLLALEGAVPVELYLIQDTIDQVIAMAEIDNHLLVDLFISMTI